MFIKHFSTTGHLNLGFGKEGQVKIKLGKRYQFMVKLYVIVEDGACSIKLSLARRRKKISEQMIDRLSGGPLSGDLVRSLVLSETDHVFEMGAVPLPCPVILCAEGTGKLRYQVYFEEPGK